MSLSTTGNIKRSTKCDNFPSDLQNVYKRIIRGNNTVTPSLRSVSSARLATSLDPNSKSDLPPVSESSTLHRMSESTPSSSSAEEIIIKQLPFHVRDRPVTSGSSNSTKLVNPSQDCLAERQTITTQNACNQPGQRVQNKAVQMLWASTYSEQSIRYVTEQVALEQARQRKRLSSIQGHRIDRKYYVNGSGLSFDQTFNSRANSAFLNRVCQRNQLSQHHLLKYSYQPKSRLDLVVNGQARVCQSLEVKPTTAETKQNNNKPCSEQSPEMSSPVNSDTTGCSATEMVSSGDGETGERCDQTKVTEKSVRSVTFILPGEDSIAA